VPGRWLVGFARRLRWTRDEVVASLDVIDPAVIARAFAYFFGIGALIVLVVPALPGEQLDEPAYAFGAAAAALLVSGLTLALYDHAPRWYLRALPGCGAALVAVVIVGAVPGGAPAYYLMNLWVVLSASYFFGLRVGTANVGGIALASGVAFAVKDVPHGAELWVVGTAAFAVTGILLSLLRERADTLILKLDEAAHTDALTGLPNRRAFEIRLEDELYRSTRSGKALCLLMIDVDDFKTTNDGHGHAAGDAVLKDLAGRLASGRRIDLCSRLGGDEFALLLPDTEPDGARHVATRLLAVPEPRVSIGMACYPADAQTGEDLQRAADCALYVAKHAGGHDVVAFEQRMLERAS
jgi:diguanylate cyclase (GGDEF)-like protein